jgi:hypothetical protein
MPAAMQLIGNDNSGIAHELGQVRGFPPRRRAEIEHQGIRSRCQNQRGKTGGERLRMNIAEEILQQFARWQRSGSLVQGVILVTHCPERYAFLLEHPDEGNGGYLEAIHAKVIGKRPCVALQKGIKIRDKIAVVFEQSCHEGMR